MTTRQNPPIEPTYRFRGNGAADWWLFAIAFAYLGAIMVWWAYMVVVHVILRR